MPNDPNGRWPGSDGFIRSSVRTKQRIEEQIAELARSGPVDPEIRRRLGEQITYEARQEQSRPLMDTFGQWLETAAGQVLPKSPIGESIAYARSN